MPVKSVVGPFEASYSAILLRRGVPVGVVYSGNIQKLKWSHDVLEQGADGATMSNFDDDGARPVPYLQLVSPVKAL